MSHMVDIYLREAVVADGPILESYQLEDSQYTTMPMEAMTESLHIIEKYPILILVENDLAGFFILEIGMDVQIYTDEPNTVLLRAYSIDDRFQGKGYGKLSLERLHGFVETKFPSIKKVVLAVNHGNISAQMLYLKAGFYDTKRKIHGIKGVQFVFEMDINETSKE